MKLLFSEAKADYTHYIFPYAIWAFPENQETPGDLFNHEFLPSFSQSRPFLSLSPGSHKPQKLYALLREPAHPSQRRRHHRKSDSSFRIRLHRGTSPVLQELRGYQIRQRHHGAGTPRFPFPKQNHLSPPALQRLHHRRPGGHGHPVPSSPQNLPTIITRSTT